MKKLYKIGLSFLSILSVNLLYAQKNFLPGYIVDTGRDTLHGYIDYRNWEKNPKAIDFLKDQSNDVVTYKPTDILGFRVHDEIYTSGTVDVENTPVQDAGKLELTAEFNLRVDTTFLLTLFSGEKCLYYYNNADGRENFYIRHDNAFELLKYKKFLRKDSFKGTEYVEESKLYIGQLKEYLNDCPEILSKIKNTSYTQKSLVKLFEYYFKCTSSDIPYQKKEEKLGIEFGALAGVSLTSVKFDGSRHAYITKAGYDPSVNPSAGLFLDLIPARNLGKWSIYNELLFSTYHLDGTVENFISENSYDITTTELGASYLKINNLFRFKYPVGSMLLYVNGGISNGIVVQEFNYLKKEHVFNSTVRTTEEKALPTIRRFETGYILGTGAKYKNFSLEFRYERGPGLSKYTALSSSTNRFFLLFGYKF